MRCGGKELSLEYAYTENERGLNLSKGGGLQEKILPETAELDESLLSWYSYSFTLPEQPRGAYVR